MPQIADRLEHVRERIRLAEQRYHRPAGSVQLLAVSKTRTAGEIQAAIAAGQTRFGESYIQEALKKMDELSFLMPEWHFIGPIQSNKTKNIAEHFDWVHSLDRLKIAQRLNSHRPDERSPLNVCIQVNVSGEDSKSGVELDELEQLAREVHSLPRLTLRGLMAIPAPNSEFEQQRVAFRTLREAFERLRGQGMALDTLSMGMSDDLEAAVAEGATMVRIGTAVFGERPPK